MCEHSDDHIRFEPETLSLLILLGLVCAAFDEVCDIDVLLALPNMAECGGPFSHFLVVIRELCECRFEIWHVLLKISF